MKKYIFFLSILFTLQAAAQETLNVMTFNIRLNIASDSLNAWPYRKDKLSSQVLYYKADILGVQEALHVQMTDLQTALTNYKYVGVGRDDGKNGGEYSAIFYNATRMDMLRNATFWLSQSPQVAGSKGWDADYPRVVTWAEFKDKKNGRSFFVFNTHFDHIGKVARRESAKLLLKAVDSIAGSKQAIVMGDFNASPADEPIQIITNPSDKLHLTDTKAVSKTPHYGPGGTFNGFKQHEENDQPIDHIFFNRNVDVYDHATISESWMGRFASDHFAVLTTIKL